MMTFSIPGEQDKFDVPTVMEDHLCHKMDLPKTARMLQNLSELVVVGRQHSLWGTGGIAELYCSALSELAEKAVGLGKVIEVVHTS